MKKQRLATITQSELSLDEQLESLESRRITLRLHLLDRLGRGAEVEAGALCARVVVIHEPMLPTWGRVTELIGEDVVAGVRKAIASRPGRHLRVRPGHSRQPAGDGS